jgi:hypothetical protein
MDKRNYRLGGRRNWHLYFHDVTDTCFPDGKELLPPGSKILDALLYDPGECTHCCSFEANLYMREVYCFVWVPSGAYDALTSEQQEALDAVFDDIEQNCQTDWHGYMSLNIEGVSTGIRVRRLANGDTNMDDVQAELVEWEGSEGGIQNLYQKSLEVCNAG